ncbi:MAG: ferredoxin [Candidatus Babeliaceae bacterium]
MKKVIINPGCITCGACEFIAPAVFEVTDICRVKTAVNFEQHKQAIESATAACPVSVIEYEE